MFIEKLCALCVLTDQKMWAKVSPLGGDIGCSNTKEHPQNRGPS